MERNESLDQDELFDDDDDDDDYDEEVADLPIFKSERSEDISNKEKHRETFVRFDGGNKSHLTLKELHLALEDVTGLTFDTSHIHTLADEFDKNEDGTIDFSEFELMLRFFKLEKMKRNSGASTGQRKSIVFSDLENFADFGKSFATYTSSMDAEFGLSKMLKTAIRDHKTVTENLLKSIAKKLISIKDILCIQDDNVYNEKRQSLAMNSSMMIDFNDLLDDDDDDDEENLLDPDFKSAFEASEMRCLALVSHNGMKKTMREFVVANRNLLKKFRLTGTNSTMTMLREVFKNEPPGTVVFGPACASGPLGGDAELVAHMVSGKIGGIIFFQDPMDSHPHRVDIDCLVRQVLVHNVMMAQTPSSALMVCQCLRQALIGKGRPELIPSFFFSLQSPTVEDYKSNQKAVIQSHNK